jgi:hypothetical protein
MKTETINRRMSPTAASLRELPEIDFSKYRIRRNPYAGRIKREGVKVVHDAPSTAALTEMPEVDFARARVRPNKFATQAGKVASKIQYGKGRPRKGDEIGRTPARSLRLPETVWRALEREAQERVTTVHALLRELVVTHVSRVRGTAKPKTGKRSS